MLRSAATNARPQHQLEQRIISVVINGDALGNCYRAVRSFPPHRSAIASAISSPLTVQISSSSLSRQPLFLSLSLSRTRIHLLLFHLVHFLLSRYFIPLRNCIPSVVKPRPAPTESSQDASLSASRFNCLSMPSRRARSRPNVLERGIASLGSGSDLD